jgi:CheY-like chemotaxis protein/HPt (histidine-containing phosphotransfer) domain-containing protein
MRDTDRKRAGYVLLAEDNPVSQAVASAMLANLGFDVDVVADGAAAVTAATETHYQAILLDCQLPVLDGYETATEIRRLQARSRRTPIIAVTATPMRDGQERCLVAGMDDYLAKPYSLKALAAVLARWTPDRSLRTTVLDEVTPRAPLQRRPNEASTVTEPGTNEPVLDPEIVGRLQRLGAAAGEDLLAQLTTLFLADAGVRVAALRLALDHNDAAMVARTAHMLSGASANLGAAALARICATFATAAAAGDLTEGREQLDAVDVELARVRSALRQPPEIP